MGIWIPGSLKGVAQFPGFPRIVVSIKLFDNIVVNMKSEQN